MFRSEKYKAFVRAKTCIAPQCGRRPAGNAHHFGRNSSGGGTGIKADDTFTVPLCVDHHSEVHQTGALQPLSRDETELLFYAFALRSVTAWLVEWKEARDRRPSNGAV